MKGTTSEKHTTFSFSFFQFIEIMFSTAETFLTIQLLQLFQNHSFPFYFHLHIWAFFWKFEESDVIPLVGSFAPRLCQRGLFLTTSFFFFKNVVVGHKTLWLTAKMLWLGRKCCNWAENLKRLAFGMLWLGRRPCGLVNVDFKDALVK